MMLQNPTNAGCGGIVLEKDISKKNLGWYEQGVDMGSKDTYYIYILYLWNEMGIDVI